MAAQVRDREFVVASWIRSELWAQVRDPQGDREDIPRARLDFAGKGVTLIPEHTGVHVIGYSLWTDEVGGEQIDTHPSVPLVEVVGPCRLHIRLDRFSH